MLSSANGPARTGQICSKSMLFLFAKMTLLMRISRYYIDPHRIILTGKPSADLAGKLEHEEKTRIAAQREAMGEEGLKKAEEALEQAKKEHDKEIPSSILKSFPVPDVKSIAWIPVQSLQQVGSSSQNPAITQHKNDAVKKYVESDGPALPFFVQYDHVKVRHSTSDIEVN